MKFLQDKQTELFTKTGAFFAFSGEQLEEQRDIDVVYVNLGAGMICPKDNTSELISGLSRIHAEAVSADLKENGVKKIIHRELANYECQIVGDYECVVDVLEDYGITRVQIAAEWKEFYDFCVANEYF